MLIFPSAGSTIPDNIEQWKKYSEQRNKVQCLSDMSVSYSAGPSSRGSGTSPHYSHFSQSTKSSPVSVPLHRLLSPGAFPPQFTLLILTDSSSLILDFIFLVLLQSRLDTPSLLYASFVTVLIIPCYLFTLHSPTPHSHCEILQGSRSCTLRHSLGKWISYLSGIGPDISTTWKHSCISM